MALSEKQLEELAGAKVTGVGNYIQHGRYTYIIDSCKMQDGYQGDCFIAEFYVLESAPASDQKQSEGPPNPKGSRCSMVCKLSGGTPDAIQAANGNVKAFVTAFLGEEGLETLMQNPEFGETRGKRYLAILNKLAQIATGNMIGNETVLGTIKKGKNAGKQIVNNKFQTMETTPEQLAANKAILAGKAASAAA